MAPERLFVNDQLKSCGEVVEPDEFLVLRRWTAEEDDARPLKAASADGPGAGWLERLCPKKRRPVTVTAAQINESERNFNGGSRSPETLHCI